MPSFSIMVLRRPEVSCSSPGLYTKEQWNTDSSLAAAANVWIAGCKSYPRMQIIAFLGRSKETASSMCLKRNAALFLERELAHGMDSSLNIFE